MADKDLQSQDAKASKELDKTGGPKAEQARTRDVTPSIEKPGKEPTRPDRPQS